MSSRWYPLYQKGNPQIRVFLPNLFMKLVKPEAESPKNLVTFHVSIQMTKNDVKNYLKKIYNVDVMKVNTRIKLGAIKPNDAGIIHKADDIKVAYVYLPKDQEFHFPNLFVSKSKVKEDKIRETNIQNMKDDYKNFLEGQKHSQGVPGWYSI